MQERNHIDRCMVGIVSLLAFSAISAIACHVLGWIDLYYSSRMIVLPAFIFIAICGVIKKEMGRSILRGWIYGVIAVFVYDMSRIPFMMAGWGDFIPTIGDWVIGENDVHAVYGYIWRYVGNGGGLGIAFVLLNDYFKPKVHNVLLGLMFGLFVWFCLDLVLIYSSVAQSMMFELTQLNVTGSLVGHVVYGLVLGILYHINSLTSLSQEYNPSIPG